MAGEFAGKVAMITGAAGNLGSAVSRRFADGGAKLILVERSADKLNALATQLGVECLIQTADLGDLAAVDAVVAAAEAHYGKIDILVHTVGGYASGQPVHAVDLQVLEHMFNLNVRPVYVTCGRVARHMIEKNVAGKIVVVLARSGLKGSTNHGAYTASKAAAQRIMESLSAEVRDKGINVNGVLPSTIDTPPNREAMPNADFSKWVTPDDLANSIAFLASDAAKALHGVSLEVYNRA
ncbi:MAG TPA: SDR family NAD(P)-dependent oxidoreductase [Oceanobacillus sp.]|nr:SDR family NAD(P)-dependent oxidoreductase [Oceanobacillus sp.]